MLFLSCCLRCGSGATCRSAQFSAYQFLTSISFAEVSQSFALFLSSFFDSLSNAFPLWLSALILSRLTFINGNIPAAGFCTLIAFNWFMPFKTSFARFRHSLADFISAGFLLQFFRFLFIVLSFGFACFQPHSFYLCFFRWLVTYPWVHLRILSLLLNKVLLMISWPWYCHRTLSVLLTVLEWGHFFPTTFWEWLVISVNSPYRPDKFSSWALFSQILPFWRTVRS